MGTAFSSYLDEGGLTAAKALTEAALKSEDPLFRPTALRAVSGSGNAEIARWVLDDLTDARLRQTEVLYLKLGVAVTPETRDIGYDWLGRNLSGLLGGGMGIFVIRSIPSVVAGYCSAEKADEIDRTFRPIFAGTPGALELERTLERVRNCAALKDARGAEINAALKAL